MDGKNMRGSFLSLLELVIVLAIVLFLVQKGIQSYFKPVANKDLQDMAEKAGINTTDYRSITSSTKEKLQDIVNKRGSDMDAALGEPAER